MSDEAKVRELFAPIVERRIDLEGREFGVNREAAIDKILNAAQGGRRQRRSLRGWGLGLAASLAVAATALVLVGRRSSSPPQVAASTVEDVAGMVTHWQDGTAHAVAPRREPRVLAPSGELVTGAGSSARIRNTRGDQIALFENSRLAIGGFDRSSSSIELMAGSIHCEVLKLAQGQRFSVITPQGIIEVRGTAFTVQLSGVADAARTCVKVEHGTVVVKASTSQSRVGAGESWGCEPAPQAPPPERPIDEPIPNTKAPGQGESKPKVGTLDEENRLFQAGLAAERRRDLTAAGAAFDELLMRFPASPLVDDARVARARVQQAQAPDR